MNPPRISARSLTLRRGERTLVDGLDLEIVPGAPLVIRGGNGAGKSTLIRTLIGLEKPDGGSVARTDHRITWVAPHMTPPPNISGRRLLGLASPSGESPGLGALLPEAWNPRQPVRRLSTGEVRRILLFVALSDPGGLVLLDEPFSHLSEGGREALARVLREQAESRVIVLASHGAIPDGLGEHREIRLGPTGGAA